jgi:hypothetical protein
MTYTLEQLFKLEMAQLEMEHGRKPDPEVWRWSPSDIRDWAEMLNVAIKYLMKQEMPGPDKRHARPGDYMYSNPVISIWEAGSGIGTKLCWAKQQGLIEYGFELFEDYIAIARELGVQCEQRDLSDLDNQPSWEVPDIVFTARPFKDDLFEVKWENLVQEQMRPGAVLMSTFTARKPYGWPCLYRVGFRGVWVKPVTAPDGPRDVQSAVIEAL